MRSTSIFLVPGGLTGILQEVSEERKKRLKSLKKADEVSFLFSPLGLILTLGPGAKDGYERREEMTCERDPLRAKAKDGKETGLEKWRLESGDVGDWRGSRHQLGPRFYHVGRTGGQLEGDLSFISG